MSCLKYQHRTKILQDPTGANMFLRRKTTSTAFKCSDGYLGKSCAAARPNWAIYCRERISYVRMRGSGDKRQTFSRSAINHTGDQHESRTYSATDLYGCGPVLGNSHAHSEKAVISLQATSESSSTTSKKKRRTMKATQFWE